MMVVAKAPVVKVASVPVIIIVMPVVNSDLNEEQTEGCHPFVGTRLTMPIFVSSVYSVKLGSSHP
jgi:hypothetical protein